MVQLAGSVGEIDFVGISVELDNPDSVRESIRRFGIPYPQFLADDAVMERFFGSEDEAALSAPFVFDQAGRLRRLAETYLSAGDYAQAAEFHERLALLQPTRLDRIGQAWQRQRALDWIAKARAPRALGGVAAARESYDQALRLEPGNRTARREREALGAR